MRLRVLVIVVGVALAAMAAYGLPLGQWVTDLAQGARETGPLGVGLFSLRTSSAPWPAFRARS